MESKLFEEFMKPESWSKAIDRAVDKSIDKSLLIQLCDPHVREWIGKQIYSGEVQLQPPHTAQIPKDNGEFRTVYVNEPLDRVIMSNVNDCLFRLLGSKMIHPQCKSYQSGLSCSKTVKEVAKILPTVKGNVVGGKFDFHHYFDDVNIDYVMTLFDRIEARLGEKNGTDPIINLLRKTYLDDRCRDLEGNMIHKQMGIRQGNAVSAFLADIALYDLDDYMSKKYKYYVRYSDDNLCVGSDIRAMEIDINSFINPIGVHLNSKKTEILMANRWFKFLGFALKGDKISLSKNRIKTFQKEITARTTGKKTTYRKALNAVNRYLYKGDGQYSWATSVLGTINVEKDIDTLNEYVLDSLRAVNRNRRRIGGIGYEPNHPDHVISRGKGKNVKANRAKTETKIDNYYSLRCMRNNLLNQRNAYEAIVLTL